MWQGRLRSVLKYSLITTVIGGTALSFRANQYQLDSIGIVRLSRAAWTVFQIGIIYKKDLFSKQLDEETQEYKDLKSLCHKRCAQKLLELCCSNKGVYIKVGQHLAALEYLIPAEYVETMKILHSHAPVNRMEDVYKVIKEDFKKDPFEIFESIDPEPLGTASLAQVHKAKLKDGSVVAVKVQHPYVQGNSKVDMKTMEVLVKLMSKIFPEFKFQWLVDESKKNIPQELDFSLEGHNAEKVAKLFEDVKWLKIPAIRWNITSKRVLTMEFLEGGQVNDLEYITKNNINPNEISVKLGELYSKMIFIHGFVHSDPHPGNILVRKSTKDHCDIILLDHGLYATLQDELRVEYANLWMSILNRDRNGMKLHSQNLGIDGQTYGLFACMVTGRSWDSITRGVDKSKLSPKEAAYLKQNFTGLLPRISEVLQNVNPQVLLILKTNDLIRGIDHALKTGARMGSFKVMLQCCVKSVYNMRYSQSEKKIDRIKICFAEFWTLFKINLYYVYIYMKNKSLYIFS